MKERIKKLIEQAKARAEANRDDAERRGHPIYGMAKDGTFAVVYLDGSWELWQDNLVLFEFDALTGTRNIYADNDIQREAVETFRQLMVEWHEAQGIPLGLPG